MRIIYRIQSTIAALLIATTFTIATQAQQPQSPSPAPIAGAEQEAQQLLQKAHTLAIVDGGEQSGWPQSVMNSAAVLQSAMQAWGRYTLVRDPANADVVLRLEGTMGDYTYYSPHGVALTGSNPYFKLTVMDPHSAQPLWSITEPTLTGTDHGLDLYQLSIGNLVSQVKMLDGVPLTSQETSNLGYLDRAEAHERKVSKHALFIMLGVFALAIAGGAIAFHYSVQHAKENQENFCKQNNIPGCAS